MKLSIRLSSVACAAILAVPLSAAAAPPGIPGAQVAGAVVCAPRDDPDSEDLGDPSDNGGEIVDPPEEDPPPEE